MNARWMPLILGGLLLGTAAPNVASELAEARQASWDHVDQFIREHDRNRDGAIARDEIPEQLRAGFDRLDKDKDGKLSRAELLAHAREMRRSRPEALVRVWVFKAEKTPLNHEHLQRAYQFLRGLDANDDGTIDAEELAAARQASAEQFAESQLDEMDDDHDGQISKEEAPGWLLERFDAIDADQDGMVTKEELLKVIAAERRAPTDE